MVLVSVLASSPAFASDWVSDLFDKFDSACAHNDNGRIDTFDPEKLDLAAEMRKLRRLNAGCEEGRVYSRSRKEGVDAFLSALNSPDYAKECFQDNLTARERGMFRNLIRDADNLAVLTSTEYSGSNSEACSYYYFWVYRADGRVLRFTLNYTD